MKYWHEYKRSKYLEELKPHIRKHVIKVLIGMRRSGKSVLMRQVIGMLKDEGVDESKITYIDKELYDFAFIKNAEDLHVFVKNHGGEYVFIDEVQEIEGWEKAVASLHKEGRDVYITGSNAKMLSSDLATYLSGRYLTFQVFPFSFKEYREFTNQKEASLSEIFKNYVRYGGFPLLSQYCGSSHESYSLVKDLYDTIVMRDVIARHQIRRVSVFEDIARYAMDNIGNTLSAHGIAKYLKYQRISIDTETVHDYLSYLEAAFALYRVRRFDLRGKRHLEIQDKYYAGDVALSHALLGYKESRINQYLENIVYLELVRRGYNVSVGKIDDKEIDFIAEKNGERQYIQVCYMLADEAVYEREFGVLSLIKDNYPKIVMSLDDFEEKSNYQGMERKNLIQWLLEKGEGVS